LLLPFCTAQTRSGKIMRRILRKIAAGEEDSIGDVSTLADPSVRASAAATFCCCDVFCPGGCGQYWQLWYSAIPGK
jgi:hypothetical protein